MRKSRISKVQVAMTLRQREAGTARSAQRRMVAAWAESACRISERRPCRAVGVHRSLPLLLSAGLLSLLSVSCTHNRLLDAAYARPCPSPEGCVTFRVASSTSTDQPRETPVFLVSGSGIVSFGSTDADGLLLVPKARLSAPGLSVLLFCWTSRSDACTAIRLDSGTIASYDWVNVTLPANSLTRRSQALPAPGPTPTPIPTP